MDPVPVKVKTIFSSSSADLSSKVILVKSEPSMRRYLRHMNSSSLNVIMCLVYVTWRSLRHRKFGSLARMFRSSWFSWVLLRVTLASLLLSPFVMTGKRFPVIVIPLMLRLSRILGRCRRKEPI
uniref:Uncharacterized protein n=1 Tax=Leersia perrieri TaxID=77586 RepID=A0A0D9WZL7_9ORYZ